MFAEKGKRYWLVLVLTLILAAAQGTAVLADEVKYGTGTVLETPAVTATPTPAETSAPAVKAVTKYKGKDYKRVYDFTYYTTNQPTAKKYANNPARALKHFVTYGMKHELQASASFDPKSYRYGCASLRKLYRNDYKQYYLHFMKTGYKKKSFRRYAVGCTKMRKATTKYGTKEFKAIYNYDYYVAKYPSVVKKVGDDDKAVLRYFVKKGLKKKHIAKDPELYPAAKPESKTYKKLAKLQKKGKLHDGTGLIVCIDPGHQAHGDYSHESIGPGSSTTKPRVTSGAYGNWSHKNEYEINLEVSKKLKKELEDRGYKVVMTRTTHNVRISNIQRAGIANKAGADICVRIHANDIDGASSMNGVFCYAAATGNPWVSAKSVRRGQSLANYLRKFQAAATGQNQQPNIYTNDMTGINWAKMPCVIVEMGFMSNPSEDVKMAKSSFQKKIAKGLANGIDAYFISIKK